MSLTFGTGPLAGTSSGAFNFDVSSAPKHRIYFHDYPRRLRALVGDRVVLDTDRGQAPARDGAAAGAVRPAR